MPSVVDISFEVFQKLNPTENEVKIMIGKLNCMLESKPKSKQMTEDELFDIMAEKYIISKMYKINS